MFQFCRLAYLSLAMSALAACGSGGSNAQSGSPRVLSAVAALGEKIFKDVSLSASGRMACATCHDPARGHAGADNLAVPRGGPGLDVPGFRNAPSLRYLDQTPAFFFDKDGTPTGGFDRDGRADTLAIQARRPVLAAHEMANADAADLATKLRRATYADEFRSVFGAASLDDAEGAFTRAAAAVAQYQREDQEFHPYSSRYDGFIAGQGSLTTQELRGFALYNNPQKGNCAACHPDSRGASGEPPLFTDFTYDNLGVPRDTDVPANADAAYFDLGLCGPDRTDLAAGHKDLCGAFKVPTLRNIAVTAPYFHNGRFATLTQVVSFYVRRDTSPDEWYPLNAEGVADKFNDLPPEYRRNVNITEVPYNRKPGELPALSADEIDDVVAFLKTLTDADLSNP
jgi:cytochrome c peroxidase